MDYSALHAEEHDPMASSPWGNSPVDSPVGSPEHHHNHDIISPTPYSIAAASAIFSQNDSDHDTMADSTQNENVAPLVSSENDDLHSSRPETTMPDPPDQESPVQPKPHHGVVKASPHKQPYKLQGKITGLERTGRKDPILRFDVYTNLPKFRTTQFRDVRRTHSEFIKLADHLISSNPDAIVAAVPPALTSAGAGTDEDEHRVKAAMQRWINYVFGNEVLMHDEEMILFVESDFGYSPMVKRRQPATGVRRKYIKQFAPPPDDTPELHDARPIVKMFYLHSMDAGHKVDRLVKTRRGLGLAESDFGVKLGAMNVQEPHPGLANAYRKLGKTIQTTGDYHAAQGTAEATTLGDPLQYHSQDAFIVKETLTNRHILLRELLQAQQLSRSKLTAADRLKSSASVRREKVDEAISALEEARSNEMYLSAKTQRVTDNLVLERRRWFARTAEDLTRSLREYVVREIEAERRSLATLETIRPDIRSIDGSGGLSRLGREAQTRRTSMAVSQTAKGDSWSGIPRRPDGVHRSISGNFMANVAEEDNMEQDNRAPKGLVEDDDADRVDARNAASRLATSTF